MRKFRVDADAGRRHNRVSFNLAGSRINDLFSLQGRVALITGGSRGIGRMIAADFVAQRARVYVSARKKEACETTAAELSAVGECIALPTDVATLAGAATYLASRAGDYVVGSTILSMVASHSHAVELAGEIHKRRDTLWQA